MLKIFFIAHIFLYLFKLPYCVIPQNFDKVLPAHILYLKSYRKEAKILSAKKFNLKNSFNQKKSECTILHIFIKFKDIMAIVHGSHLSNIFFQHIMVKFIREFAWAYFCLANLTVGRSEMLFNFPTPLILLQLNQLEQYQKRYAYLSGNLTYPTHGR